MDSQPCIRLPPCSGMPDSSDFSSVEPPILPTGFPWVTHISVIAQSPQDSGSQSWLPTGIARQRSEVLLRGPSPGLEGTSGPQGLCVPSLLGSQLGPLWRVMSHVESQTLWSPECC